MRLTVGSRRETASEAVGRRRTIVVWGGPASGRSGLIGALRSEATKTVGERWALDIDNASPDVVAYAESSSLALRLRGVKETPIRRPERAFTIAVRRYAGRRVTDATDLTILDPRGEVAADPASAAARQVLAATRTADGLLWLLEAPLPEDHGVAQLPLLRQLVAMLEAAGATQLSAPVVVALTKVDRLAPAEMRRVLDTPEGALRSILGDAAFGWLLAAFPRLHCAALSSAGTVRNAVRPIGLTSTVDWFADEWRREEQEADAARVRARRSARVAGVRRRAPVAATVVAAASIVAFAGVAAARLLQQRGQTWASSAGTVAIRGDSSPLPAASVRQGRDGRPTPVASLATAAARFDSGDALGTLQTLVSLQLPDSGSERFAADSLIAVAAVRATEKALSARVPSLDALQLIIVTTTGAIGRAHPGTSIMATLSLARAGACIGGRLSCPPDQVREDLAWTVILGTPTEQDQARRLRAALVGDTLVTQ